MLVIEREDCERHEHTFECPECGQMPDLRRVDRVYVIVSNADGDVKFHGAYTSEGAAERNAEILNNGRLKYDYIFYYVCETALG